MNQPGKIGDGGGGGRKLSLAGYIGGRGIGSHWQKLSQIQSTIFLTNSTLIMKKRTLISMKQMTTSLKTSKSLATITMSQRMSANLKT